MTLADEATILRHIHGVCSTHREALQEALQDIHQRHFMAAELQTLNKDDRRLLDQFAYRYTRLQDDTGARLIPAILRALGEDVSTMSVLDRLNRMEQLGWLQSADEWSNLRRIRNEFTHEYPETAQQRFERLDLALKSAGRLVDIFDLVSERIIARFAESTTLPS